VQPLQRWEPEGLLQLRLWELHWLHSQGLLLLLLLLWLGPVVEDQLLQQGRLWVPLQQTCACAAWQACFLCCASSARRRCRLAAI